MRVLIVYATRYGQTRRVVERMSDVLRSEGAEVHLFEISVLPEDLAPHSADVVVLAAPAYFGKYPKAMERFATMERAAFAKVRSIFISVGNTIRNPETRAEGEKAAHDFLGRTGWVPDRIEFLAGGEPFTKYGWLMRWFMTRFHRKIGQPIDPKRDYDYTDWEQVDALARDIVGVRARGEAVMV